MKRDNASNILAYLPRHRHYIKILVGDRVKVKLDNNDQKKGRITYRQFKEVSICREFYHKQLDLVFTKNLTD
uniref:hypothetical protein n=1 Tax=Hassallia byssoidea TaxID=482630 RepID=UPI001914B92A